MNLDGSSTAWPSVSVVMPCFNAEAYIAAAIGSILDQAYPGPLEILVVDDGSTDSSVLVAGGFQHVRLLTQKNQGPAAARNLALGNACGDVIAFLDADDAWTEGSLRCRVECLMANPDIGVVFGNFTRWTPASAKGEPEREVADRLTPCVLGAVASGWVYPEILLDPVVHIIATAVRRSVIDSIGGFDAKLRTGEDYDFFIRAARHCRFQRIDRVVARYRQHRAGITRVPQPVSNEYFVVSNAIKRFGTTGPNGRKVDDHLLARRLQRMCFDHALLHYQAGDPDIAARGFRQSLQHDPWHFKPWLFAGLALAKTCMRAGAPSKAKVS